MADPSFLYVIGHPEGMKKIGISGSPNSRFSQLQSSSPYRLARHFLAVVDSGAARIVEAEAHRILSAARRSGEWFEISLQEAVEAVFLAAERMGYRLTEVDANPPPSFPRVSRDESPGSEITPGQCRAGRVFADLSQDQLATAARISRRTVTSFETGERIGPTLTRLIQATLEDAGVEFTPRGGVEPRAGT